MFDDQDACPDLKECQRMTCTLNVEISCRRTDNACSPGGELHVKGGRATDARQKQGSRAFVRACNYGVRWYILIGDGK